MNIETKKLRLIEQLIHVKEESTLKRIQELLKEERMKAYKANLQPMSTEELEEKLDQSEQDIEEGRYYTTEEVRKHFKDKKAQ